MTDLYDLAENVKDRKSFLDFVDALASDFAAERTIEASQPSRPYGPGALGWENGSIDTFLDACTACVREHMQQADCEPLLSEQPIWRELAQFLLSGKYYE